MHVHNMLATIVALSVSFASAAPVSVEAREAAAAADPGYGGSSSSYEQ